MHDAVTYLDFSCKSGHAEQVGPLYCHMDMDGPHKETEGNMNGAVLEVEPRALTGTANCRCEVLLLPRSLALSQGSLYLLMSCMYSASTTALSHILCLFESLGSCIPLLM